MVIYRFAIKPRGVHTAGLTKTGEEKARPNKLDESEVIPLKENKQFRQPDRPHGRRSKRLAGDCKKAEQAEAYKQQLSELVSVNVGHLSAFAEQASDAIPSAAPLVESIVAAYSASAGMRVHKFHNNEGKVMT